MLGKQQDQSNTKNNTTCEMKVYRPVSILPVLSKVYENLVLEQPAVFIERESIYHQYQSAYRKNHSLRSNIKTTR